MNVHGASMHGLSVVKIHGCIRFLCMISRPSGKPFKRIGKEEIQKQNGSQIDEGEQMKGEIK